MEKLIICVWLFLMCDAVPQIFQESMMVHVFRCGFRIAPLHISSCSWFSGPTVALPVFLASWEYSSTRYIASLFLSTIYMIHSIKTENRSNSRLEVCGIAIIIIYMIQCHHFLSFNFDSIFISIILVGTSLVASLFQCYFYFSILWRMHNWRFWCTIMLKGRFWGSNWAWKKLFLWLFNMNCL